MALQIPPAPPTPDHDAESGVIEDARRRQRRHRQLGGALLATVLLAGGLIASSAGGGGSGPGAAPADRPDGGGPVGAAHLSRAAIRADAIVEARALLARVRVPAGWVRVGHVRVLGQGNIAVSRGVRVHGKSASVTAIWLSPLSIARTLAQVETHPPAGSTLFVHGWGGSSGQISEMDAAYQWPLLADNHGVRDLTGFVSVRAFKMGDGRAALQVSAQATGLRPRPANETVPVGVHTVTVRLQLPPSAINGHRLGPVLHDVITTPAGIRQAVRIVDSLAITQTSTRKCRPAHTPVGSLTVTYSGAASRALAQATVALPPGWLAGGALAFSPGRGCDPIAFSIRGRPQEPLAGFGGRGFFGSIVTLAGFAPRLLAMERRP
jgi:hypothetical protein